MRARARELAAVLHDVGVTQVSLAPSYEALEARVRAGEADAAWAPPLVCARLEQLGARVALRALRDGVASYRSVLVVRRDDALVLTQAGLRQRRPRAAWVDRRSMGGFILARALLAQVTGVPGEVLREERFLGSYEHGIEAVLEGESDLTATFAGAGAASSDGFVMLAGGRALELRALAYSAECPNDGVVLSPRLDDSACIDLTAALVGALENPAMRSSLAAIFAVTGFEEPPVGSYVPLLTLHADAQSGLGSAKEAR